MLLIPHRLNVSINVVDGSDRMHLPEGLHVHCARTRHPTPFGVHCANS